MTEKQKRPITIQFKVGLGIGAAVLSLLGFGATTQLDDDERDDIEYSHFEEEDDD